MGAALNHPNVCTLHDVGPDYLSGNVSLLATPERARGRQGRPDDPERIRGEMEELAARHYVQFVFRAHASAGRGDLERFYQQMDQALDERELAVPVVLSGRTDGLAAALPSRLRLQALLRRD